MATVTTNSDGSGKLQLVLGILSSYLFFLLRRPISNSNSHYLAQRIKGLKSLAPLLASSSSPQLQEIAEKLQSIQPANLSNIARDLQVQLVLAHKPSPIPADYVVSNQSPGPGLFANVRRVLLALCPAIGIGDEMIFFPVPASIKATLGGVHIAVMSAYRGLWDRVRGVDERIYYSTHRELLSMLQGGDENSLTTFDLIIFGDFEKPGLAPLVCLQPGTQRYVEISLGAQYAAVVDNNAGSFRSVTLMPEARLSYYAALDHLLEWLGIGGHKVERYKDVVEHELWAPSDSYRMFVSPFTSKYNPSLIYWSKVLGSLWTRSPQQPVEIVLDPGTNSATERFSSALARSAMSQAAPGISFSLAGRGGRGLSLQGVFEEMERSHAVLCADSFAAHAGPLFGCTTLVVASPGLESWRTPSSQSYYFDTAQSVGEMGAAMRQLLGHNNGVVPHDSPAELSPVLIQDASRLIQATQGMMMLLNARVPGSEELTDAHAELIEAYDAVIRKLPAWPGEYSALFHDVDYGRAWWQTKPGSGGFSEAERRDHLKEVLTRWENTNLCKLLRLISTRSMVTAGI
ncbi:MAG: hypothetical protein WBC78_27330 [Candidatus Sulfotelmatobacter sp.]